MASAMYAARARLNALQRHRGPDDPVTTIARLDLREAKLAEDIVREAESDPPLTAEQRARLAVILLGPVHQDGGAVG